MGEHEVYVYSLNSDQNEQILKMTTLGKHICFILQNQNEQKYTAYVTLEQLKDVCKAFNTAKTLNNLLIILHNNIEAGNISLIEDEQSTSIELKFTIKLASKNFPPFSIKLELENENSLKEKTEEKNILPAKFDYRGNVEAEKKYGKTTKNTTEYNKPIVQPNYKKPIVQLEYIEPILQVHYPDGTTKSKILPARIQTVDGQIPDIDEAQFKRIQEEMNRHMANQEGSKYSLQTVVVNNNTGNILASIASAADKGENNNEEGKAFKSKYSTFSVPAKPIVYPEQKVIKHNAYQSEYTNNTHNNIIEYAPNIINIDQYKNKSEITYNQTNANYYNYDNLFNQEKSYTNYNSYNNYSNALSGAYQNSYYTQNNSFDFKNIFNQNQYQSYQNQPQNYQYLNYYYSSSYPQSFPQQFEQAFAEVIPLNPIQEFLQSQMQTKPQTQPEQAPQKEKKEEQNNEKNEERNDENNEEENEIIENKGEIGDEGEEREQAEEQAKDDIEQVFRTEEGLIIFRNGILKGIIQKYAEIDNVVTRIQDILLKGAKFNLLYKATIHGDKAKIFHEKCDNQPRSLVIVETDKGIRFGGFTIKGWEGHCEKKIDNNAFVFSIDKNKIFDIVLNEPAVGAYPKFGPVFFGCQIRIYNDFFTKGGSTCYKGLNYKTTQDFELNNGEQKYIVKDIEVYGIETIDVNV